MSTVILSANPDDPIPMPSEHLLELIYEYASLKSQNSPSLHYTLHSSVLIATGVLVNDYIKELLTPMVRAHVRKCLDEEEALYGPLEDSELDEDPEYEATVNAEMGFIDSGLEDNVGGQDEEDVAEVNSDFEGGNNPLNDRLASMADLFEKQLTIDEVVDESVDKEALQVAMEASGILTRRQKEAVNTIRKTYIDEEGNEQVVLQKRSTRLYQLAKPGSAVHQLDSEELAELANQKRERALERKRRQKTGGGQIVISDGSEDERVPVTKKLQPRRSSRLNSVGGDAPEEDEEKNSSPEEKSLADIGTPAFKPKKHHKRPSENLKHIPSKSFIQRQRLKAQQRRGDSEFLPRSIASSRPVRPAKELAIENITHTHTSRRIDDTASRAEARRRRRELQEEEELAKSISNNPKGDLAKYKAFWGQSARTTPPPVPVPKAASAKKSPGAPQVPAKKATKEVEKAPAPPPPAPYKRKPPTERHPLPPTPGMIRAWEKAQQIAAAKRAEREREDEIRRAQRRERRRQRALAAAAAQPSVDNMPLTYQYPELQSQAEFDPLAGLQTFPGPLDPYGFNDPLSAGPYIPPPLGGSIGGFDPLVDDDFGANDDPFAPLPSAFPLAPPDRKRPKYDD